MSDKSTNRISSLDALRGLAIAGTLGTNIWALSFPGSDFELLFAPKAWWAGLDEFLLTLTLFLTNGKFLGLLAILFGVGLELQRRSSQRRGHPFIGRYAWRNILLLAIGVLHFIFVYGYDILMGYALAALVVMGLATGSNRRLIIGMIIAGALHLLVYGALCASVPPEGADLSRSFTEASDRVMREGSYLENVLFRLEYADVYRFEVFTLIGLNTVLFGIGILLVRAGLFEGNRRAFRLARRLVWVGLVIGVPLNLVVFAQDARLILAGRYFFAPLLSLLYLGLGVLLFHVARGWLATALSNIGRAALTCYILQNLLAAWVFAGWGLGLKGSLGGPGTIAVWLSITAAYALAATLWLRYLPQGPVEGVWRKLAQLPFGRG